MDDDNKTIDKKAASQRKNYTVAKKSTHRLYTNKKQSIGNKASSKAGQKNNDTEASETDINKHYKSAKVKRRTQVFMSSEKKSLLGKSESDNYSERGSRSRLIGKSNMSAIRKTGNKKSLRKYAVGAGKKAVSAPGTAMRHIKDVVKQKKIQEIINSQNPSDMVAMIGEKGIQAAVKFTGIVIKFIVTSVIKLFSLLASVLGPYMIIIVVVILVIFVPLISSGGSVYTASRGVFSDVSSIAGFGVAAGSVQEPRIEGTDTALTYRAVHNSPWYSAYVGDNHTPFCGDNGLDKIKGDRGGNCTAYVWGRRCELEGQRTQLGVYGDAYRWYARELSAGIYKCGQTAKVGAVACWSYGTASNGHVAIVEKINRDGSIVTSNSAYGSMTGVPVLFYNATYGSEQELKDAYAIFQGYIYLEKKEN